MIKLEKLEEPELLREKKEEWLKEYLTACQNNQLTNSIRYRYREESIKTRIKEETFDKCAYCESKITHCSPGDIEHILPKSKFLELIFTWSNLTFSCTECNRRKSDYHNNELPLINPYQDNPTEHLMVVGNLIYPQPKSKIGKLAQLKLELNRTSLVEKRRERIERLINLANGYTQEKIYPLKQLLLEELKKEVSRDKEYSFTTRNLLQVHYNINLED